MVSIATLPPVVLRLSDFFEFKLIQKERFGAILRTTGNK